MKNYEILYNHKLKRYNEIIVNSFDEEEFIDYSEVLFSSHSCGIEGNSFTVNETNSLKELGYKFKAKNKRVEEIFEILDHFDAYRFFISAEKESLSEVLIKEGHRILMNRTLSDKYPNSVAGEYAKTQMAAGDTIFGDYKENIKRIPKLLAATNKEIREKQIHPMIIAASFHKHFIYLHPFRDGNGRLGRLLSNFILAKFNLPNVIIDVESKMEYIDALKASEKHKNTTPIVHFFFDQAIQRMDREIKAKKNPDKNYKIGMKNYPLIRDRGDSL